jgi:hypothetical protein
MLLQLFICDEPFSIIFLDIWQPGKITEKDGSFAVLTMLEGMCSFAVTTYLPQIITAETQVDAIFSNLFAHFSMPNLIIVDADSKFCGMFKILFENLGSRWRRLILPLLFMLLRKSCFSFNSKCHLIVIHF